MDLTINAVTPASTGSAASASDGNHAAQSFEAQLAKQEPQADAKAAQQAHHGGGSWFTHAMGILQAGAGALETVGGVAGGILTSETGIGAVAGGAIALHGLDDIQAGLRQAWSGQSTETFTQQAATGAAAHLGASPGAAMAIGMGVDIAAGGGLGGGEKAAVKALEEGGKLVEDGVKAGKDLQDAVKLDKGAQDAGKLANAEGSALREVEVASGSKGNWSKELNHPQPNTVYHVDNTNVYRTDEMGRVSRVDGELSLTNRDRNTYQQAAAGHSGKPGDEGGHLIATIMNGPGEKLNLVPMNGNLNKGAWKQMENSWAEALKDGKPVAVTIEPVYAGKSIRPESFNVTYRIGNERPVEHIFKNSPGGI